MSLPIASEVTTRFAGATRAQVVVNLEHVSVRYRVPLERFGTFKEYLIRRIQGRVDYRDFWALYDIDLEIHAAEVFGVIGRNGAGKSTLLKVISRVLRPTRGRIRVWGQVAPLLDLGAGFHPELTGRENVFLNGALLGRSQAEVVQRFEEIVGFAELGPFIDAPLRTYSSGMVARLGFAVATAWEPDLLVLDEVMAVGDEMFQQKCHDRIRAFRQRGTTVILVSHNMGQVQKVCQRAAWIDQGVLIAVGNPTEVVAEFRNFQPASPAIGMTSQP